MHFTNTSGQHAPEVIFYKNIFGTLRETIGRKVVMIIQSDSQLTTED
jgi:hypothetical protein